MADIPNDILQDLIPIRRLIPVFGRFSGISYSGKEFLHSKDAFTVKDNPSIFLLADILASVLDDGAEAYGLLKDSVQWIDFNTNDPVCLRIKEILTELHGIPEERLSFSSKDQLKDRGLAVLALADLVCGGERNGLQAIGGIGGLGSYPETKKRIEDLAQNVKKARFSLLVLCDEYPDMRKGAVSVRELRSNPKETIPDTLTGAVLKEVLKNSTCSLRICLPRNSSGIWYPAQRQREIEFINDDDSGVIKFRSAGTIEPKHWVFTRLDLEELKEEKTGKCSKDKKTRLNKVFSAVQDASDKWSEEAWLASAWKLYRERGHGKDTRAVKSHFEADAREVIAKAGISIPKTNIVPFRISEMSLSVN